MTMIWTICRDCLRFGPLAAEAARCDDCSSPRLVRHAELNLLDIAHVDCDAFYASVEKRDDPSLRDKPVIVGHAGGRGVVTTACYVARRYGPRSAMPMFKALEMCPDAIVIEPDMAKYKRVSNDIRIVLAKTSDCIEPVSLDEAYIDLTSAHRLRDEAPARALAEASRRIEREIGITISIGLSYNKFLAKLASDLKKPRGYSAIGRREAIGFLAELPVSKIHGVGRATAERMAARGFDTIADLQRLSERELVSNFGKFGERLAQFVQGRDPRRVTPDRETKSISAETTFRRDTGNARELIAAITPMCDRVAERCRRSGLAGQTIVLKLKTSDFRTLTRNHRLSAPTVRADIILEHASALILREAGAETFRLIGVGLADLSDVADADPPDLFSRLDLITDA
jgi:DNA polymerase-4